MKLQKSASILVFLLLAFSVNAKEKTININFEHLPLSEALGTYANFTGKNLIVDSQINDIVDLKLKEVTPSAVLRALLEMYDLILLENNGIVSILKRSTYESRNQSKRYAVRFIKYHAAAVLLNSINDRQSQSKQGVIKDFISVNNDTNAIILQGKQSFIDRNLQLIDELDVQQAQLVIEAKLVGISDSDLLNLGVTIDSSVAAGDSALNGLVDLGVASSSSYSFLISKASKFAMDLKILALAEKGDAEIISEPKIFTRNNRKASISQGVQIPYQVQGENGAFHSEFKDANLLLSVLPRVADQQIFLEVLITKDSPNSIGESITINTRRISSNVRVLNGDTVILGGIVDSEKIEKVSSVPYLSDIPWIGSWLFTSIEKTSTKRNLVVFLTPKIIL